VHNQFADERIGPTIPCKHIFCAAVGGKQSLCRPPRTHHGTPAARRIDAQPRQMVNAAHAAAQLNREFAPGICSVA
jgi:hypothetical protein